MVLLLRVEMKRFWIHRLGFIVVSCELYILFCRGPHHILHFQLSITNCALMLTCITMAPCVTFDDFQAGRVTGRFIDFAWSRVMTHQAKHVLVYCAVCIRLLRCARIRHLRYLVGVRAFQLVNYFVVALPIGLRVLLLFHRFLGVRMLNHDEALVTPRVWHHLLPWLRVEVSVALHGLAWTLASESQIKRALAAIKHFRLFALREEAFGRLLSIPVHRLF